ATFPGGLLLVSAFRLLNATDAHRSKILIWRLLPVSDAQIGRVLCHEYLGLPMALAIVGVMCNIFYWDYQNILMVFGIQLAIVANVGIYTILRLWPYRSGTPIGAPWAHSIIFEKFIP